MTKFIDFLNEGVYPYYTVDYEKNKNTVDGPTGGGYGIWVWHDNKADAEVAARKFGVKRDVAKSQRNNAFYFIIHVGLGWKKAEDTKGLQPALDKLKKAIPGITEKPEDYEAPKVVGIGTTTPFGIKFKDPAASNSLYRRIEWFKTEREMQSFLVKNNRLIPDKKWNATADVWESTDIKKSHAQRTKTMPERAKMHDSLRQHGFSHKEGHSSSTYSHPKHGSVTVDHHTAGWSHDKKSDQGHGSLKKHLSNLKK